MILFGAIGFAPVEAQQQNQATRIYESGPGTGVSYPALLREVSPTYTNEAMKRWIQGTVLLDAIVLPDGHVGQVNVFRSLDAEYGLDDQAIAAARRWEFEPARLEASNTPVPTRVRLELEFLLPRPGDNLLPALSPQRSEQSDRYQPLEEFEAGAYREGATGVVAPNVLRSTTPVYTSDGMRQKIQGVAEVDVVVGTDGSVLRARLAESIDPIYGLDGAAVAAARRWTFVPGSGTLNGLPVPVIVRLKLEFRIH
jgi:TonB family protein